MIHPFIPSIANQIAPHIHQMPIAGLFFIPHTRHDDERGFYAELSRIPELENIIDRSFLIKQINLSHSLTHVTRGFHAENWSKLLSVTQGTCFCAWADFRPDSKTFGDVVTMTVGDSPDDQFGSVFVSAGIGNSFCVTDGPADYLYAVDQLYAERDTSHDLAISVFDPDLDVPWPIPRDQMIISERDQQAILFREKFPQ